MSMMDRQSLSTVHRIALERVIADPEAGFIPFKRLLGQTEAELGVQAAFNLVLRLEAALGKRRPTMAIYDHTFHLIGGGQKYGLTVADVLQDLFDITIIANKPFTHRDILNWYQLDLGRCAIKIIEIPFFAETGATHLDPARVTRKIPNPFHAVSLESGNYDFFINNSMNEMVFPLAPMSYMICHFPERRPKTYFYADQYRVIYNSDYTAHWIEQKWKFKPHKHIYPPVDMEVSDGSSERQNIILSVARFEVGGSKKQLEMIRAFAGMRKAMPEITKGWKLVLAGGSQADNPYLEKIREAIAGFSEAGIEIAVNIPAAQLKDYYRKAKIFWHLCGLNQKDPALVEHFGMTICEAMQNRLAPIVFDGGGQREIVDHGISGFRVKTLSELPLYSARLIREPELLSSVSAAAYEKSKQFSIDKFNTRVREYFSEALDTYTLKN